MQHQILVQRIAVQCASLHCYFSQWQILVREIQCSAQVCAAVLCIYILYFVFCSAVCKCAMLFYAASDTGKRLGAVKCALLFCALTDACSEKGSPTNKRQDKQHLLSRAEVQFHNWEDITNNQRYEMSNLLHSANTQTSKPTSPPGMLLLFVWFSVWKSSIQRIQRLIWTSGDDYAVISKMEASKYFSWKNF